MPDEAPRSRAAREAAERALVRVVRHYGARQEFVVLGGLVPELLCAGSGFQHAGTTDVDVQVDLEIACGAVNASRLEQALRSAEFKPDNERVWRSWPNSGASWARCTPRWTICLPTSRTQTRRDRMPTPTRCRSTIPTWTGRHPSLTR